MSALLTPAEKTADNGEHIIWIMQCSGGVPPESPKVARRPRPYSLRAGHGMEGPAFRGEEREYGIADSGKFDTTFLAARIAAAYFRGNSVPAADLSTVIRSVHVALTALVSGNAESETVPKPAVSIRKSVTADYVVCLEDGKKLKMLKRYLRSHFNLTPEAYRAKWGLPIDYPMVAPNYSKKRSDVAKASGLGRHKGTKRPRRVAKADG